MNNIDILEEMFFDNETFEPIGYIETNFTKEQQQAIKNLIAENKELKEEKLDYTTVYLSGVYDEKKRWKQQVNQKIHKLEIEQKELEENSDFIIADVIQPKIEVLQSLLGKE